jgi:hypothetical protein
MRETFHLLENKRIVNRFLSICTSGIKRQPALEIFPTIKSIAPPKKTPATQAAKLT